MDRAEPGEPELPEGRHGVQSKERLVAGPGGGHDRGPDGLEPGVQELLHGDPLVGDELASLVIGVRLGELVGDLGACPAVEVLGLDTR